MTCKQLDARTCPCITEMWCVALYDQVIFLMPLMRVKREQQRTLPMPRRTHWSIY